MVLPKWSVFQDHDHVVVDDDDDVLIDLFYYIYIYTYQINPSRLILWINLPKHTSSVAKAPSNLESKDLVSKVHQKDLIQLLSSMPKETWLGSWWAVMSSLDDHFHPFSRILNHEPRVATRWGWFTPTSWIWNKNTPLKFNEWFTWTSAPGVKRRFLYFGNPSFLGTIR